MKKTRTGWAALVMLVSAASLLAHHSLAQFDTTTGVTVKGTVVLFQRVNPHSFLFIDQKGKDGQMHRWAIEGPGVNQLTSLGIGKDIVKAGDVIEACGYVMKEGFANQRTVNTEPISLSLKETTPKSVSGEVLTGELLVMPDGKKQRWTDYGQHKCLGPEFDDFHVK